MASPVDLRPDHLEIVQGILREHLPVGVKAWVFGSRANWTTKESSDLDLALDGEGGLSHKLLGALKGAFEDSVLPYTVDVVDLSAVSHDFKQIVEGQGVPLPSIDGPGTANGVWREIPFAQLLVEPVRNGIYKKKKYHGRGVKLVNMGELFAYPRLRDVHMRRVELSESEKHRFGVQVGDLLFARRSLVAEGAGKCSVVLEADEPTTFESSIIRARPDPTQADSLFLYYYFNSPSGLHSLDSIRRQVAVAGITGSDLARLVIPLPSLPEQRAIAHVLGTLDDKIELNRRMNETLEQVARALFKSWFVDFDPVRAKMEGRWSPGQSLPGLPAHLYDLFPSRLVDSELGETPDGWEVKMLGDVAHLNPESWSKTNNPSSVEYVDLANTKWGVIESTQHFSWKGAPSRARRVLRPGDTIVGTVRPGNGSYSLIGDDGLTGSTGFAVVRPLHPRFRELIYLSATAPDTIEWLAHRADGAAYPAVRPEVVSEAEVAIPAADTGVLAWFSKTVGAFLDKIESAKTESRALSVQRDVLLPRLVSGKVVIHKC